LAVFGLAAVLQASGFDGVAFDPFSFQQDGLTAPEVDIGRRQVADALVVPEMVEIGDEVVDLLLEIARKTIFSGGMRFLSVWRQLSILPCVWGCSGARDVARAGVVV
jgi:hypothetical protein